MREIKVPKPSLDTKFLTLLFYTLVFLPLIYIPEYVQATRGFRFVLILGIPALALSWYAARAEIVKDLHGWNTIAKLLTGLYLYFMLFTCVKILVQSKLALLGTSPDYLGAVTWIAFLSIGVVFKNNVRKQIFSRLTLYIFGACVLISLISNASYVRDGFRVPGVMLQSTSMAMHANIAVIMALFHIFNYSRKKFEKNVTFGVLLLSALLVVFCQSRIGNIMLTTTFLVGAYIHAKNRNWLSTTLLMGVVAIIIVLPMVLPNYFSRFRSENVQQGVSYRTNLYRVSGLDLIRNNMIFGNGPASLPVAINNPNTVPEDIAKTLKQGFLFTSTHDLFFDVAYYFGAVAALVLGCLVAFGFTNELRNITNESVWYALIFLCLLLNAVLNVPSLELTSLFFIVLFGSFSRPKPKIHATSSAKLSPRRETV